MGHTKIIPKVGDAATYGIGSDAYPATVIEVSENGNTVKIQMDDYEPAEGFEYYGNQVYDYERNPNGAVTEYTWRKRGVWVEKGLAKACGYVTFGHRRKYTDPSF